MKKLLLAAVIAASVAIAPAHAATVFVFKGAGNNVSPEGTAGVDFEEDCASVGDYCSVDDHSNGLNYSRDGYDVQVIARAGGDVTRVIQDISPSDSGLGAWSETNGSDDQTQADSKESIEFIFSKLVTLKNVEFNAGGDRDCTAASNGSGEGTCGEFRLDIYDLANVLTFSDVIDITNTDFIAVLGKGAKFVLTALTAGSGFTVAQFTVSDVPVPAALPLLLSGLAGLGFASRKRKRAA